MERKPELPGPILIAMVKHLSNARVISQMKRRDVPALPLICGLLLTFNSASAKDSPSPQAAIQVMDDGYGVMKAMATGDVSTLDRLANSKGTPGAIYLATPAALRVRMSLSSSTARARECVEAAKQNSAPAIELACSLLAGGNSLVQGDIAPWARSVKTSQEILYPKLRAQFGKDLRIDVLEKIERIDPFLDWPTSTRQWSPHPEPLRFQRIGSIGGNFGSNHRATVTLQMNGKRVDAVFDTGSFMSLLSEDTAKSLDLAKTEGWWNGSDDPRVTAPATALAVVRSVAIGPALIKNQAVAISPSIHVNTVGLDSMIAMKRLRLVTDGVEFPSDPSPGCSQPMLTSSTLNGMNTRIMLPIQVSGSSVRAALDTGSSRYLTRIVPASSAPSGRAVRETVLTYRGLETRQSFVSVEDVNLGFATFPVEVTTIVGQVEAPQYAIGLPILQNASIYLDFVLQTACIEAREQ